MGRRRHTVEDDAHLPDAHTALAPPAEEAHLLGGRGVVQRRGIVREVQLDALGGHAQEGRCLCAQRAHLVTVGLGLGLGLG